MVPSIMTIGSLLHSVIISASNSDLLKEHAQIRLGGFIKIADDKRSWNWHYDF